MRQQIGTTVTAAALFLFSGCQGAKEMIGVLGELQAAARAVAKATSHENVTAHLANDRFLTIGMVNSALGALPDDRREAEARKIAQVAFDVLPSRASLDSVRVSFVVHRRYFLLFNYTNALDSFEFKASELARSPAAPAVTTGG